MLGLTAIELAAMKGQPTDKARAQIAKEKASLARQQATEQQVNAEREAGFAQLAESEIQAVTAQIKALVAQFIEPLQGYAATVNGLQGDYFVSHCRHAYEAGQQQAIRDQLTQTINEAQALIDAKLGENTQLAQSREPTEIGLIGVNLMDVEILSFAGVTAGFFVPGNRNRCGKSQPDYSLVFTKPRLKVDPVLTRLFSGIKKALQLNVRL